MIEFILAGAIFLFSINTHKNIVNPVSIFSGIWLIILFVYQTTIIQSSPISDKSHLILAIGIASFAVGSLFAEIVMQHKQGSRNGGGGESVLEKDGFNYRIIFWLCIVSVLCLLPDAWNSIIRVFSGDTFQEIRANHSSGNSVLTNQLVLVVLNYVINPFCVLVVPICAIDFISGKKTKWLFCFMIIITFLETFVSGGRIQLVYVPLHFLIVFFYDRGKLYISRRTRRRIFLGIAVTFIVVNAITSSRGSNWEKETIGLYVSGGIPLMDHYVSSFNSEYTFGAAALSGYLRTIFSLLENVGFVYPRFLTRIQQLLDVEEVVYIGSLQMNAFVTLFYYFFIDGGLWGFIWHVN